VSAGLHVSDVVGGSVKPCQLVMSASQPSQPTALLSSQTFLVIQSVSLLAIVIPGIVQEVDHARIAKRLNGSFPSPRAL